MTSRLGKNARRLGRKKAFSYAGSCSDTSHQIAHSLAINPKAHEHLAIIRAVISYTLHLFFLHTVVLLQLHVLLAEGLPSLPHRRCSDQDRELHSPAVNPPSWRKPLTKA